MALLAKFGLLFVYSSFLDLNWTLMSPLRTSSLQKAGKFKPNFKLCISKNQCKIDHYNDIAKHLWNIQKYEQNIDIYEVYYEVKYF